MINFTTVDGKRKCVVGSRTLSKGQYPGWNRQQRRDAIYRNQVRRLIAKIEELRYDMIGAGLRPEKMPRQNNRKVLSGYMSRLIAAAR